MLDAVRHCTFSARLDCHYQLGLPDHIDGRTLLVVALHGFGQTADVMLPLVRKAFGPDHIVACLEGPYQFFKDARTMEVGYGWITSRHAPESIRLHHDMVQHVLNEAGREYGIPPGRRILLGFSQPVSLNYRFAATFPDQVRGVVAVCGGIPGDWDTATYRPVTAAVLHIARREDEFYPPQVTEQYPARLRSRIEDLEFQLIDGGHLFPSKGNVLVAGWLERILR